ncbi:MAG: hypothetical protein A3F94_01415 [Candidatus Spechtbacteria bacterium RIFCSPLOWO2_12_FULL_38_22]|uniref:Thymidylate kinase n=1 Tax=Candidatus Spechtbacteria bacterium RIFCSPLOWO2_12_FULL_38_22 TaxID=1802165 RepID=A0A1G2HG76_9BACT|nr:MAG: hypothetical protein A2728_01310 [Candidatus Spechtbacteria bacterium RIFCSPHIGHO2_01_FULL_38_11]OGZ60250.1 MAG: hypothetical protein A3E58_01025 [Candidatus Spechtbacteria bacterium RIFCSPHIGHO2_12_FULL_38_30]OGZ60426.1 MAG: hypothetical protein A3A00_00025 [Candidatus Spechtbacteria bacterium RIFCSPLOWO2_01_FULL_38_20]OGZ61492.1 MAG: hypothetical protein A3F94_01415 [Candidatus Spechtbacteria bacterium RIFCSPLOWO2_12_FULL_38_22]
MKEEKMSKKGLFVVIEGIDGVGKKTQAEVLKARLESQGHDVELVDFPRYDDVSSAPVRMYLNGELGDLKDIGAEAASLLFAFDRKQAADQIRQWLESGKIVLSNRYVASNLGHQGGKIQDTQERERFWDKLLWLEYEFLQLSKPDINIILYLDPNVAYELVGKKGEREYLAGKKRDIHEQDMGHLFSAADSYRSLSVVYPDQFTLVDCSSGSGILSAQDIGDIIWKELEALLVKQ